MLAPVRLPDPAVLPQIDVFVADVIRERDALRAMVRDLAGVYTVDSDQVALLALVQRARTLIANTEAE